MIASLTTESEELLAQWPWTRWQQSCCSYPHGDMSIADGVFPAHERTVVLVRDEGMRSRLAAIEAAVRDEAADRVLELEVGIKVALGHINRKRYGWAASTLKDALGSRDEPA